MTQNIKVPGNDTDHCFKAVKRYSLAERSSKVVTDEFAKPLKAGSTLRDFLSSLPHILAASEFRWWRLSSKPARLGLPVILGMGAHPIKTGLSPLIINLMEEGIVTGLCTNGAAIIHDFEIAYTGCTSEDVATELCSGSFGMAEETGRLVNQAITQGVSQGHGIGKSIGAFIAGDAAGAGDAGNIYGFKHRDLSIFANACKLVIPATVHVAIGTDIIHMHPEADGAAIGAGSLRDFKLLTMLLTKLEGGVFINLGSAVIIPEVFLKALNLARNTGHTVKRFTTINMDFNRPYRPSVNVLTRPTMEGGKGIHLTGHHEIMFPLLAAAIMEQIDKA